ncbi:hypothetical protein CDD82_1536 [Ophiocordyceps australis]|uniref:DUF8004 domain-containing protein n=1 Tax=Ophiocordyceps australis TaxID=1399860 RepID=A0A2C5ZFM6_9HYPO|nr:hypothetical protein CDD82_1536 [Ophiocordyceps australis]
MAASGALKRWDAGKGTCEPWSGSGRDSDLWVRDGNCLIYLRAKDRARRAPSFRLPFSSLLDASCFPLIERYLVVAGQRPRSAAEITRWHRSCTRQTVELLIPPQATPGLDAAHAHATAQYLAVRNFVAWVLGKPLVGESLGSAYIALLTSMYELRSGVKDNVHDLVCFLRRSGHFNLVNRPDYAVAALVFAETFRLRDVYLLAFAHCVGMSPKLALSAEYQNISSASKTLLSQARQHLNSRMAKVAAMLANFADDELSETHLGIPAGVRAHLERFRSFLLTFYSSKLGYYPPRVFDAAILRSLAHDFAALYRLLQDQAYQSVHSIPHAAVGGICTLQLVQALDARHAFDPLPHPLPLLPLLDPPSRRLSWLPRDRHHSHQVQHAALVKASNWDEAAFGNPLVRAYRRYEGDLVLAPAKTDKTERASLADARKVRWILVYALHQALRHVGGGAPEVRDEPAAPYLLTAPVGRALPWSEDERPDSPSRHSQSSDRIEIVPDIDYFALTHRQRGDSLGSTLSEQMQPQALRSSSIRRSNSISHVLGRNSTLRRSLLVLPSASPSDDLDSRIPLDASPRSASTALASSIITSPSPTSPALEALAPPPVYSLEASPKPPRRESLPLISKFNPSFNKASLTRTASMTRRPISSALEGYSYAITEGRNLIRRHSSVAASDIALRRRSSNSPAPNHAQHHQNQSPSRRLPHVIDEEDPSCLLTRDSCDWNAMQAFLDGKPVRGTEVWEHYTDLGGLTELA